jgi:DNA-binding transcriptional MerR regulator
MNGDTLHTIGDLARRTGLTVKTIRFYSDQGIVPPVDRNPAGHRLYDLDALARLDLVRTLRELGLDLATIRKVVDREITLAEVAAAHADALAVQIRTLRSRRAVLTAVARRGSTPEEMELMHHLAKLSENERHQLIGDFLDSVFGGPEFEAARRTMTPELPDDPDPEQVEAWVRLAELSRDEDFRAVMRQMTEDTRSAANGLRRDAMAMVRDLVRPALADDVEPESARADAVVAAVMAEYAPDGGPQARRRLLARVETAADPRRDLYLELLAVINGWPPPEGLAPFLDWFGRALRPRLAA